jgi:hypothetical protein
MKAKAKTRPATGRQLMILVTPLRKLTEKVDQWKAVDPEAAALAARLNETWMDLYRLGEARAIREAEKADRGEVLWTLFIPESYRMGIETRTPRRRISTSLYRWPEANSTYVQLCDPRIDDPWHDLAWLWRRERKEAACAA